MKKKTKNILLFISVFIVLFAFVALRNQDYQRFVSEFDLSAAKQTDLPILLELGGRYCPGCIEMKSVLKEIRQKYPDDLAVAYIDVHADIQTARDYNVSDIPLLIFMDKDGNNLYRHTGYMSEEEIIKKWNDLNILFKNQKKTE